MRTLISIAVTGLLLVGAASASASTSKSGLWGVVRRGPITPVCSPERPCSAPAAKVVLVFSRNSVVAARALTNRLGSYRVALRPGTYTVRVDPGPTAGGGPIGRGLSPSSVHVVASRYVHLNFTLDTGIR